LSSRKNLVLILLKNTYRCLDQAFYQALARANVLQIAKAMPFFIGSRMAVTAL
jgi:hypothetical protein